MALTLKEHYVRYEAAIQERSEAGRSVNSPTLLRLAAEIGEHRRALEFAFAVVGRLPLLIDGNTLLIRHVAGCYETVDFLTGEPVAVGR